MRTKPVLAFAIAALSAVPAVGQDFCDKRIPIETSPTAYQPRGDRCEGLIGQQASTGFAPVEVVSLIAGSAAWDPSTDPLLIEWRPDGDVGEISLRASSLPGLALFYRMDTRRSSKDGVFRWPTNLVRKVELTAGDIGLIAWRNEQIGGVTREVLIPLSLGQNPPQTQKRYSILLSTTQILEKLALTLIKMNSDGGYGATVAASSLDAQPLVPSRPIGPILVDAPHEAGLYHLRIRGQLMNPGSANGPSRIADYVIRAAGTP